MADRLIRCPCGAVGKLRPFAEGDVCFWKRADGAWWRDDGWMLGVRCGYCGVPSETLVWNGWAQRKRAH